MAESRVNLQDMETGTDLSGPCPDPVKPPSSEASQPELQGLLPAGHPFPEDMSPSPSAEASGLLSLPWEVMSHIAVHLPAQCIIKVLPKVCHALANVRKDNTAWQHRAHRLIGSQRGFPVGPKEDFDWLSACLEMEQLINCWTDTLPVQEEVEDREEVRPQDGDVVAEGQEAFGEDEVEGAGVEEVAYGDDEAVDVEVEGEDDDIQPIVGEDQLERLRMELDERLMLMNDGGNAAAPMEEERDHRMDAVEMQHYALNHREDMVDPKIHGNGGQVEMERCQSPRSPSPPPALECVILPPDHIGQVNSVLLLGGEGAVCATGSRDHDVKLWDLQAASGATLTHTLLGQGKFSSHLGWVWCLASRGPMLASGAFDSTVRLWDLQAGGAERGLIKTGAPVVCLSWQTDVLLAGTMDSRINMYDTRAANPLVKSLHHHRQTVLCLAEDENYIISGSEDHKVVVYDRRAGKTCQEIKLRSYLISMSYGGCEVWAGDNSGKLHCFSMQAGTLKYLSRFDVGHKAAITGIHRSPGSLYTCSSDRTVKVHIPCAPPRTLCTMPYQHAVSRLSVEAGVLAVASRNESVEIWRPRK